MLCDCGCGQPTRLAPQTVIRLGWVAGQPIHYINGHNGHTIHEAGYTEQDCGYKTPCWVWNGGLTTAGYSQLSIGNDRQDYAHRVYWERENGPVPEGLELDHLCRNHSCVRPSHLEPVTHIVNLRRGAATKLTEFAVREVRVLLEQGLSYARVAKTFGVGKSTIGSIATGESWKDVL